MKDPIRYLAVILFSVFSFLMQNAYAATIDKIITFGDSLSDNGNLYGLMTTLHATVPLIPVLPKDPPYYRGRFSNGPVWVEQLAQFMHVPLMDYAYGGSWVESVMDSEEVIPFSLGTQVNFYLVANAADVAKEQHLYVLWSGGNDYIKGRSDAEYATTNTVSVLRDQLEWLIYYGAKKFLIVNVPDLSVVPEVISQGPDFTAAVGKLSNMHDQKLAAMVAKERQDHPDVKFVEIDIRQYYDDVVKNPGKYHLTNIHDACYGDGYTFLQPPNNVISAAKTAKIDILTNPSLRVAYLTAIAAAMGQKPCDSPDEYLFWDKIHPTRVVHIIFAQLILSVLNENDINV